jgi:hypothetical protein
MARWEESEHPRWPAGSPGDVDGQFRPKAGGRDLATLSRSTLLKYARERGLTLPRGIDDDAIRQAIRRFDSGGGEDWAARVSTAIERKKPAKVKAATSTTPSTSLTPDEQARVRQLVRRDPQIFATTHERYGDISTSGNLSQEGAAWLQRAYKRDRVFVEHAAQTATIDRDLRRKAKDAGQTPAEYRAAVAARLKELLAGKPIAVRVRDEAALRDILDGGRFKTQHEGVQRAAGLHVDVGHRRLGEQIHGVPAGTPPDRRPVYGYVAIAGIEPSLAAGTKIEGIAQREGQEDVLSAYGEIQVVLKPEVRGRTTVTVGDSLDEIAFIWPTPIDDPGAESLGSRDLDMLARPGFTRTGYVEAQVRGGVRVEDIAGVVFSRQPSAAAITALERRGIPWQVLRPGETGGGDWVQRVSESIEQKRSATESTGTPRERRKQFDALAGDRPPTKTVPGQVALDQARMQYGDGAPPAEVAEGLRRAADALERQVPFTDRNLNSQLQWTPAQVESQRRSDVSGLRRLAKALDKLGAGTKAPKRDSDDDDLVTETVQRLQAARSETEGIKILAGDPRLRASVLKKIAESMGIEIPEDMRAKSVLQLHIAERARQTAGEPFNTRRHGPGTRVSWNADGGVTVFGTVGRKGRFTVVDWDSGRQEKVRANIDHPSIRVVPAGSGHEPRDMLDRDTATAILGRVGARPDVKVSGGMYQRSEYWVDADPVLEEIVYDQWGGAPAAAVGADEFDRMRADRQIGLVLYRGVEDGNAGVAAEQIHSEMTRQGKTRLGNGIFGNGWYMATTRRHAEAYGLTARYGLRADARTTTWEDLLVEYEQWEREQKHRLGHSIEWSDRRESAYTSDKTGTAYPAGDPLIAAYGGDLGRFAAARGYDAYRVKKGTSPGVGRPAAGNQWVILNRGALVADTETRTGKVKP